VLYLINNVKNYIAVLLIILVVCTGASAGELMIVKNSKAVAVLVIPDNATPVVIASAKTLNQYLKLISGTTLPVKREGELKEYDAAISLGSTKLASKTGLNTKQMKLGQFICRLDKKVIFILGKNNNVFNPKYGAGENGSWNGMCRFTERFLGVRWLWPGKYGLVAPKSTTISISMNNDFTETPAIKSRKCRTTIYQSYWKKYWKEIGIDDAEYKRLSKNLYDWQKFHLMGGSISVSPGGHGFTKWWDLYNKNHPEWFAMQADGTRNQAFKKWGLTKYTVKLCVSNPEVINQVIDNAVEHYKKKKTIFMGAINDGGNAGFCLCEKCVDWDKPEKAPPFNLKYASGAFDYCSLSDRYVKFWNKIAEGFSRKCPGKFIAVSAYGCITPPPVINRIKYDCILLGYVGFDYLNDAVLKDDRKWWKEWSKRNAGKMLLRSNMLCEGYGLAYVYTTEMGRDYNKFFSRGKVYAVDNDTLFNYWGTNGINYYMLYKLMWNPSLDAKKELNDYCEKGFGKAAPMVKLYFKEVEKITKKTASHNWNWKGEILRGLPTIYTPKRLRGLNDILEKAHNIAVGDDKKRVEFLQEGLEYTKILSDILRAKATKSKSLKSALEARNKFFKNQKFPFSAPYPADKFWRRVTGNDLRK
jgi:Domain of unknown function (DUF4838)